MDSLGFGQHVMMDHRRAVRRAEARERLVLEEQAARGLLDDNPIRARGEERWGPMQRAIGAIRALLGGGSRRGSAERPVPLAVPDA
jgi:hypothetical protein